MKRETHHPPTRDEWLALRAQDITSTEVAALFGCSPYLTEFELYHRLKDQTIVEIDSNERLTWGVRLQDAIADGIGEDQAWTVAKMNEYMRLPEAKLGASFDFRIVIGDKEGPDDGVLEIKNVDGLVFREGWVIDEDGTIEAPLHIEIQLQTQLLVSGLKWGYIGALVGGNESRLVKREADPHVQTAILNKVAKMWGRVAAGDPPPVQLPRDAAFITQLYSKVEKGNTIEATAEVEKLADQYASLSEQLKQVDEMRDSVKAKLLMAIGTADKVKGDGFSISAGEVAAGVVESFHRKAYRLFRVHRSKPK